MTINGDDYASGFHSKDAVADGSSDSFSDEDDDSDNEEAERAHMKRVTRKVVESEMDPSGIRQLSTILRRQRHLGNLHRKLQHFYFNYS